MIAATQGQKIVQVVRPGTLTNATATSNAIDTLGYNYITFFLVVGTTTGVISVFKVQDCATSGGSYVDVTGASLTTLPGATDDDKQYAIDLNLRDRSIDRYLKVVLTENNTGSGTYGVYAILSDGDTAPTTATLRGLAAAVAA